MKTSNKITPLQIRTRHVFLMKPRRRMERDLTQRYKSYGSGGGIDRIRIRPLKNKRSLDPTPALGRKTGPDLTWKKSHMIFSFNLNFKNIKKICNDPKSFFFSIIIWSGSNLKKKQLSDFPFSLVDLSCNNSFI